MSRELSPAISRRIENMITLGLILLIIGLVVASIHFLIVVGAVRSTSGSSSPRLEAMRRAVGRPPRLLLTPVR